MIRAACFPLALSALLAAGCASVGNAPSLATRTAETIDPRLPVPDRSAALSPDPGLSAALAELRTRALAAAASAEPSIRVAADAASAAGGRESESWIRAQQLISAAIAARAGFTRTLGELDSLIALRIRGRERLVPQDLALAEALVAELNAVDRRQGETLARAGRQLQR
jgi:hypothetical protein